MERYIQPFVEVCVTVCGEFLRCEVQAATPFFITRGSNLECDISGIIGLAGEARGAVAVSMKKELAFQFTETLTGQEYTEMNNDVTDAIGEMVNIIAGNAKQRLEDTFNLVISLPSVIIGPGHEIKWPGEQARIMCIPFKVLRILAGPHSGGAGGSPLDSRQFWVSVALESSRGAWG